MARSKRKQTNELEFQGQVIVWLNDEIRKRPGLRLDKATQEKPRTGSGKRNDLVVWSDRVNELAFLAIELKTPATPINDPAFLADAIEKARHWKARYFALWNMREAEIYPTPPDLQQVLPDHAIYRVPLPLAIAQVEDWLKQYVAEELRNQARALLDSAVSHSVSGEVKGHALDTEIFVTRLTAVLHQLRGILYRDLTRAAAVSRALRKKLKNIATEQGFSGFVKDIDFAIAGQIGYRFIGQILFYFALRRRIPKLKEIKLLVKDSLPEALVPYWNDVRRYDYEALFEPQAIDSLVPLAQEAQTLLRQLIEQLATYDWASLTDDDLGSIFEQLIPREEQLLLGQFYTPRPVADLLVALTIDGERPLVLDPGCGSGTFLMSAYSYLAHACHLGHKELLSVLWGFDISPFAAESAVINLYRQDLSEFENFPRVVAGDFFARAPGQTVGFPAPRITSGTKKVPVSVPIFDCIVGNPPYLRSQNQDDLDPEYRKRLFQSAANAGVDATSKTDLFAFFIYHSLRFMREGSRLGFVTPASWLTSDYASALQRTLLGGVRLVAVIASNAESFFPQVDVNTVLLVAEKPGPNAEKEPIRFVTLKKPIAQLTQGKTDYWSRVTELTGEIEAAGSSVEGERLRIKLVDSAEEQAAMPRGRARARNWSKYLRAPLSYYQIFEDCEWFVELSKIADAHLGYKSLQNTFFYVNQATIDTYGIEPKYLTPILKLRDIDVGAFHQEAISSLWLFNCSDKKADLRGTRALRYIEAMANRAATEKKQSGKLQTIQEALESQGGGLWYAPKARLNHHHVWLRKAFNTTFAPFLFNSPALVDQRCNSLSPRSGYNWREIAAIVTTSLFAYGLEINGAAGMGAGALEAPTTKLRAYPVLDLARLSPADRKQFATLAEAVWVHESPVDWGFAGAVPGPKLRALDEWIVKAAELGVELDTIYSDLNTVCQSRILVANDKVRKTKKRKSESIGSVSDSIAKAVAPRLQLKKFPEDFAHDVVRARHLLHFRPRIHQADQR